MTTQTKDQVKKHQSTVRVKVEIALNWKQTVKILLAIATLLLGLTLSDQSAAGAIVRCVGGALTGNMSACTVQPPKTPPADPRWSQPRLTPQQHSTPRNKQPVKAVPTNCRCARSKKAK